MSGIFPLRGSVDLDDDREPRLVDLDEDVADEVFDALSSRTTRTIFAELHTSPQTASDLAEVTDTSVQNVQYHLQKLMAADLVEVVDTWYSERGTEMKVYAPTDESLVLFAGSDREGTLRALLKRVVGVLGVLLPGSAAVAWLADRFAGGESGTVTYQGGDAAGESADAARPDAGDQSAEAVAAGDGGDGAAAGAGGGDGAGAAAPTPETLPPEPTESDLANNTSLRTDANATLTDQQAADIAVETPQPDPGAQAVDTAFDVVGVPDPAVDPTGAGAGAAEVAGGVDPAVLAGLSFFLGGVFVLALVAVAWYVRT